MLFKEVLQFFEFEAGSPKLRMDSKAAKAIVIRLGVGMVRHLEVKILWIQSLTEQKRMQVWKIDGDKNIADLGTKVLAKDRFEMLLQMSNIRRMKDVEKIPETKCIGGVGLDAGCTAPADSVSWFWQLCVRDAEHMAHLSQRLALPLRPRLELGGACWH